MGINWNLVVIIAAVVLLYLITSTSWRNIKQSPGIDDVTRSRTLVSLSDAGPNGFSVVTYNILAGRSMGEDSYPYTPQGCRTTEERHPRLLAELQALDGDILLLQEVEEDYLVDTLGPALNQMGYRWSFKPKTSCCEGLASFYKKEKFKLIDQKAWTYDDMLEEAMKVAAFEAFIGKPKKQDRVYLMLKLRHKATKNCITVGNIHTTWDHFEALPTSTLQLSLAMQKLVTASGGKSHIISGDMNSKPWMSPYRFLETGNLTEDIKSQLAVETSEYLDDKPIWQTLQGLYRFDSPSLASSYKTVMGKEPDFTNYESHISDCLDYIWYSEDSLIVHNVLSTVTEKDIEGAPEKGLPNCLFPSDHLSLKTVFSFSPSTRGSC